MMGKNQGPVSQSRTMWVKKGEIVNGKKVEKGYLAQLGKPEKRVTASVKIETATKSGKKAGEVYRYKAGQTVKPGMSARSKTRNTDRPATSTTVNANTPNKPGKPKPPMSSGTAERLRTIRTREQAPVAGSVKRRQAKQNIQMTRPLNPASLVGGSVFLANMTKKRAMSILREVEIGNRKISAVNRRLLEKYIQGTR